MRSQKFWLTTWIKNHLSSGINHFLIFVLFIKKPLCDLTKKSYWKIIYNTLQLIFSEANSWILRFVIHNKNYKSVSYFFGLTVHANICLCDMLTYTNYSEINICGNLKILTYLIHTVAWRNGGGGRERRERGRRRRRGGCNRLD